MKTNRLAFALAAAAGLLTAPDRGAADTFGSGENQFAIDFVTIGNPRNPPDTTHDPNPNDLVNPNLVRELYIFAKTP